LKQTAVLAEASNKRLYTVNEGVECTAMAPPDPTIPTHGLLDRLQGLINTLPHTLPLNPTDSNYHFDLDPDDLDEGHWFALNRRLEIAFQVHTLPKSKHIFTERGPRLNHLIITLRAVLEASPHNHLLIRESWIEPLLEIAYHSGAKESATAVDTSVNSVN
jgi:hypothetical protein